MTREAQRNARDHGFLWRISKDGHASYLYGTIHVGKYEWMFPGPQLAAVIRETDLVALELDLQDVDIQVKLSKGIAAMPHTRLNEHLKNRIKQQADAVCLSYADIVNLPPEMQVTTLTSFEGRHQGLEPAYGIDVMLARMEHAAYKPVLSLETPELQLKVLQMNDSQDVISFVEDSMDDIESGRSLKMLDNIVQYWADSNYEKMENYAEWCDCLNTELDRSVMKRSLDDRNPSLANKIDELHKGKRKVLAAVGSLHMFGSGGLPALMEKRGYKVERIHFK